MQATLAAMVLALGAIHGGASVNAGEGDIAIADVWARASPPMAKNGAAYMTLSNTGDAADRLLSVGTDVAERAELHNHVVKDGVAVMGEMDAVEIEPGAPVAFRPGGMHVMLISLESPLNAGDSFDMTLSFAEAGEITVEVPVHHSEPGGHDGGGESRDSGNHSNSGSHSH